MKTFAKDRFCFAQAFISAVEDHPSNPTISAERKLSYQLVLKSKVSDFSHLLSIWLSC